MKFRETKGEINFTKFLKMIFICNRCDYFLYQNSQLHCVLMPQPMVDVQPIVQHLLNIEKSARIMYSTKIYGKIDVYVVSKLNKYFKIAFFPLEF